MLRETDGSSRDTSGSLAPLSERRRDADGRRLSTSADGAAAAAVRKSRSSSAVSTSGAAPSSSSMSFQIVPSTRRAL
eukprot:6247282-Prymnesium_polylepis.1